MTPSGVIDNADDLNFCQFVEKFNPIGQAITEQRYGNLVRASFGKKVAITQERTKRLCQEYVAKVAFSEATKLTEDYDRSSTSSDGSNTGNDRRSASDNVLPPNNDLWIYNDVFTVDTLEKITDTLVKKDINWNLTFSTSTVA
ncbi:hypothetical protein [Parasitella parasitica]|uniref:Uncharacterized protein n=1 Tax=Parasitella parasitica TaxID=35722 RepID=A0A0B7N6C5_9FUNG|nr:hypothetical protein [Parasitella parasitica]